MGKGDRKPVRFKKDRERKKRERDKRKSEAKHADRVAAARKR